MKKKLLWGGLLVAFVWGMTALLGATSCALNRDGLDLFGPSPDAASCEDICIEAAAGNSGDAGLDADVVEVPDVCDCGVGGQGGTAGTGGQGGIAGSGGEAGQGGTAGTGGIGGQGGTAGAGGQGGAGGSGPLTCSVGDSDTPVSVTVTGGSSGAAYVSYWGGPVSHTVGQSMPIDMSGNIFPAQIIGSGANGLSIVLYYGDGGAQPGEEFYLVNVTATGECIGVNYYNQVCDDKVAQDFRCTYFPTEEVNCSLVTTQFTLLGLKTYDNPPPPPGNRKVLVSVRCEH